MVHHPCSAGVEHSLCEQHPCSHGHLARADHVGGSSGKIPGTAEDGGSPDLLCNLLLLHIILLTSDCSPGVGRQGEGIGEQECLQARARCGTDVVGPVWSSLHVAVAGLWLLGWFQAFLGCD